MLISASNVEKSFDGIENIIEKINLGISFGDRIGIIGVNGSGKSTLLNILSGRDTKYKGVVQTAKSTRIGILDQIVTFSSNDTLFSECKKAFDYILKLQEKIDDLEQKLESKNLTEDEKIDLSYEYSHYIGLLQEQEGFNIDYKIERVLMGLGFPESFFHRKLNTFSGGERRRALLAKVLIEDTNVLFLDEPTNHLDIPAIDWVIDFINSYYGAVVIVSHDKRFLNKTVNKIYEIEFGKGTMYRGSFDNYVKQKEQNLERQIKEYETQQKHVQKTEEFIRKYMAGQRTKEAQGRQKRLERMELLEKPMFMRRDISVKGLLHSDRSGLEVASLEKATLGYDNNIILNDVNLKIFRNDKIVIVGNNGIGKTTLVKALTGENEPLSGEAKTGYNVKYVYFTQNTSDLDLEGNLIDFIYRIRPDLKEGQIRNLLAKFYFTGDKVFNDTNVLSGGEKTRLTILSFILKNANLLLLDEPTNHLDIFTIDSLGSIMNEYPGTIIAISHDREFIDQFAEKIILIRPDGVDVLEGNFSDNSEYIMEKLSLGRLTDKHYSRNKTSPTQTKDKTKKEKAKPKKKKTLNVFKINKVEKQIDGLEKKLSELTEKLGQPEVASNYKQVQEIQTEIDDMETQIIEKMEEWEQYHK